MKGYWHIYKPHHPFAYADGYVREHRLVYEESRNCCLLPTANIHHIDGNRANNVWYNLILYSRGQHMSIEMKNRPNHWIGRKHKAISRRKMAIAKLGVLPGNRKGKFLKKGI